MKALGGIGVAQLYVRVNNYMYEPSGSLRQNSKRERRPSWVMEVLTREDPHAKGLVDQEATYLHGIPFQPAFTAPEACCT